MVVDSDDLTFAGTVSLERVSIFLIFGPIIIVEFSKSFTDVRIKLLKRSSTDSIFDNSPQSYRVVFFNRNISSDNA